MASDDESRSPRAPKGTEGAGGRATGDRAGGSRATGSSGSKRRPRPPAPDGLDEFGRPVRPARSQGPDGGKGTRGSGSSGGPRPSRAGDGRDGPAPRPQAGPKQWGSLGRRGAARLGEQGPDARDSVGASGRDDRPAPVRDEDRWVRVDDVRDEAGSAVARGRSQGRGGSKGSAPKGSAATGGARAGSGSAGSSPSQRRGRPARKAGPGTAGAEARDELVRALGPRKADRANERLRDAAHAFERERYDEARTLLRPLAEQAPQAPSVRELLGLTYYRLGRWKDAVRELEAFRQLTDSTEQHPVLADCYRALKRPRDVEALWDELREASPSGDLVTEGRIVMAGSLADRKQLAEAIALLEKSHRGTKRVQVHHLRQAYVLADLYERAGDVARARELFRWILAEDPEFADAAERVSGLA